MVHYKQLENGVRLIVKRMPGLLSVSMGILVHTGAAFENDEEDGISHFIEHMLFKGTETRTAFRISDETDRIGAQMNAFTGKDITCYYAKSTTAHAAEAFGILSDIFLHSNFPEEEMSREKGVIIEEISMTEDTPEDLCLDLLPRAFYGKEGYGRNILGSRKNVRGFTRADVDKYMAKRYVADNIVIAMAGNIQPELAEELAEKYFGGVKPGKSENIENRVSYHASHLHRKKEIEQVHFALAYPSVRRYAPDYDATQIMNSVLGGSMSSKLFQKVREQLGLAYNVYSYVSSYAEAGALVIYAGVNCENYLASVEAVLDCVKETVGKNITRDEFLRGKEQLTASSVYAQESTSSQMLLYGKELLYSGKIYDFEKRVKQIESVTYEDVLAACETNFNEKYLASAIVGNVDSALKL